MSFHLDLTNVQQLTIEYDRLVENEPMVLIADSFLAKSHGGYPTPLSYTELLP